MKKGFTLVELLAVIVILAVILVIAVPLVLKVVDNSRLSAYLKNEQMVLKALDLYVSRNTGELPGEVGSTTEVSINYLVSNGMLTEIINPYNKNEDCTGYVTIMKLSDTEYDYTPHLRCGLDIHNSNDDGLVLHYKFDDFQEPTENLLPLNAQQIIDSNSWSAYDGIAPPHHTWGIRIDREIIQNGYLGIANSMRVYNFSGLTGSLGVVRWNFLSDYDDDVEFTWSAMVRAKGTGIGKNLNVHRYSSNSSKGNTSSSTHHILTSEWTKVSHSWINREGDRSHVYLLISATEFEFEFALPQVEKKPYSTPFVEGTREGIVKDYSGNGNHANLDLNNTPRWIENSKIGTGSYDFFKLGQKIEVLDNQDLRMTTGGTISAWIYPRSIGQNSYGRIIDKSTGVSGNNGYLLATGPNNTIYFQVDATTITRSVNNAYNLNTWNHILVTFNNTIGRRIYVDGVDLTGTGTDIITVPPDVGGTISFGNRAGAADRTFDGFIDDLRLYNRILTNQEVKLLYESKK